MGRLQRGDDAECRWFQKIAEQGHYGGREGRTRQGIYFAAPDGTLLTSLNHRRPDRVVGAMRSALEKWKALSTSERSYGGDIEKEGEGVRRLEAWYPENGMALRVHCRDLPRPNAASRPRREDRPDWRSQAWNVDNAWLDQKEARALVPDEFTVGATRAVPRKLVARLARLNLTDNVRGQTRPYKPEHVETATLTTTITEQRGDRVCIVLEGRIRMQETGSWNQGRDEVEHDLRRGYEGSVLGYGEFETTSGRFKEFTLVSLGTRWGATRYNARADDLAPSPVGYAMTLMAADDPRARVAPAWIWHYHWKQPWK